MPQALDFVPHHIDQERILERPEQAAHLALISVLWNRLEINVTDLISAVLPRPLLIASGLLQDIMRDLVSLDIRSDMIRSVAANHLNQPMREYLDGLLREVRTRAKERVKYIHSEWHMSPDIPDGLIRIPRERERKLGGKPPKMEIYKIPDFVDYENRLKDLSERVIRFGFACAELRRPPQALPSQDPPPHSGK